MNCRNRNQENQKFSRRIWKLMLQNAILAQVLLLLVAGVLLNVVSTTVLLVAAIFIVISVFGDICTVVASYVFQNVMLPKTKRRKRKPKDERHLYFHEEGSPEEFV